MSIFAIGACSATALANFSSSSRVIYGMAQKPKNIMLVAFADVHPKYHTPWKALIFWFIITSILVLGFGSDMTILLYVGSFVWLVQYILVLTANLAIRFRFPDKRRLFKVPGGTKRIPILTVLGLVLIIVFLTLSVVPPFGSLQVLYYGAGLTAAVIIYSIIWLAAHRPGSTKSEENLNA